VLSFLLVGDGDKNKGEWRHPTNGVDEESVRLEGTIQRFYERSLYHRGVKEMMPEGAKGGWETLIKDSDAGKSGAGSKGCNQRRDLAVGEPFRRGSRGK